MSIAREVGEPEKSPSSEFLGKENRPKKKNTCCHLVLGSEEGKLEGQRTQGYLKKRKGDQSGGGFSKKQWKEGETVGKNTL